MARKFLYLIAIIVVLFVGGRIAYEMFQDEIAAIALVPSGEFTPTEPLEANAYQDPGLWYSRPGIGVNDPARWQPAFASPEENGDAQSRPREGNDPDAAVTDANPARSAGRPGERFYDAPDFAVFFIHPTSYLSRENWNAPIGDEEAERVARIYLRGMASPFNAASEIWAPRYRQATMGAFLTDAPEGDQAIDAAYADIREAFRFFVDTIDDDMPIVVAGHSQGSLHLLRLLREEVRSLGVADRLVAAYAIGWPVSVERDLPTLGLPACATPNQTGCLISWSSFAEPADPAPLMRTYSASTGFDGSPRSDSQILCTNPLTGSFGGSAPASANLGTLVPDDTMSNGELVPAAVPATCDERGLLLIGDPPRMGSYVLPGNNYHVYDIPLFWANTKADVVRRVRAFARTDDAR
ncbi:DUF3089 domain-containing protein [Erythrobacter sp.]|jgi:hypothetical protein|uniref:DUF3089 domain-containing protein n=1 Tax=Erythrobacter sp. TaxID=1042 RepID=UPI002EB165E9|nr:DUF3089 domain-containing protein [Erythrobacter sp.]